MTHSRYAFRRLSPVWYTCLVLALFVPPAMSAGEELRGKVYRLGPQDKLEPVVNATVRIETTDDSDVTTSTGGFRLYLPASLKPGHSVTLQVELEGYRILRPYGGKIRIPALPLMDPVRIELDQTGSHRFMNHEAFALLMEDVANKAKAQIKADDQPQDVDLGRYLREWAVKYGFGLNEVQAELDKWATEIEATSDNFYELGLAAFYKKNFGEAATNFTRSAQAHEQQLTKVRKQASELTSKAIRDYVLAGNAYSNAYRFQDAIESYRKALRMAPRNDLPQDWAMTQNNLGIALRDQGVRTGGEQGTALLAQAVDAYRDALQVYTRNDLPQQWATTQNNLGATLRDQGVRTGGEQGTALLAQAVDAYRDALQVRTRNDLPQQWAMTQSNLGNALRAQGVRTGGEQGTALLAQAVDAYRDALQVRTRNDLPQQWATTQNNLGNALFELGKHNSNADMLKEAEIAIQAAYNFYIEAGYKHYRDYFDNHLYEIRQFIKELE